MMFTVFDFFDSVTRLPFFRSCKALAGSRHSESPNLATSLYSEQSILEKLNQKLVASYGEFDKPCKFKFSVKIPPHDCRLYSPPSADELRTRACEGSQ